MGLELNVTTLSGELVTYWKISGAYIIIPDQLTEDAVNMVILTIHGFISKELRDQSKEPRLNGEVRVPFDRELVTSDNLMEELYDALKLVTSTGVYEDIEIMTSTGLDTSTGYVKYDSSPYYDNIPWNTATDVFET